MASLFQVLTSSCLKQSKAQLPHWFGGKVCEVCVHRACTVSTLWMLVRFPLPLVLASLSWCYTRGWNREESWLTQVNRWFSKWPSLPALHLPYHPFRQGFLYSVLNDLSKKSTSPIWSQVRSFCREHLGTSCVLESFNALKGLDE